MNEKTFPDDESFTHSRVKTFLEANDAPYLRVVCQDIVANIEYPNHIFRLTNDGITIPSSKITIYVES